MEKKLTKKPEDEAAAVVKPKLSFYAVLAKVTTPTIYGMRITSLPESTKDLLKKKYGEEAFEHLDSAFPRAPHPITGQSMVFIPGRAVYTALKTAAGLQFKPLSLNGVSILGAYFPEESATIHTSHIETPNKSTLMNAEAVNPGYQGHIIILGDPSQIPGELKAEYIQIGRNKRKGYGLLKLEWP